MYSYNKQGNTSNSNEPVLEVPESPVRSKPIGGQKRPTSYRSRGSSPGISSNPFVIGDGNKNVNGNGNGNESKPFPMLFASATKKPRITGPESNSKPERLVSLSDRFSYREPVNGTAHSIKSSGSGSSILGKYSAMLDGNGKMMVGYNGGNNGTLASRTSSGTSTTTATTTINKPKPFTSSFSAPVDEKIVNQLKSMFTSPIETILLAVKVYKTFDKASEWLSQLEANRKSGVGKVHVKPQTTINNSKIEVSKPTMSIRDRFSSSHRQQQQQQQQSQGESGFIDDSDQLINQKPVVPKRKLVKIYDEDEYPISDDSENEDEYLSPSEIEFEERLLDFLNTASLEDIVDVSSCPEDQVKILIEARPFKTLEEAKAVRINEVKDANAKRRGGQRKAVGEKIVDGSYSMLKGYEAVDSLIQECSKLGKEVASGIKQWGVDLSQSNSELEITQVKNTNEDEDEDEDSIRTPRKSGYFSAKPKLLANDFELKDYQQVGINWLSLLYKKGLSCILADEMGLGKTCQVIAFLAHLKETGLKGPHLVVVPASTLENWLREFNRFCPSMVIEPYYGSMEERANIRDTILESNTEYDVMVTTYNLACGGKQDHAFLRSQKFNVCVYDEGHLLKNSHSERYSKLMKLKAQFRLILTGTPLQNNLRELVSLLSFILPNIFQSRKDDLAEIFKHKAKATSKNDKESADNAASLLLSEQRINKAKTMMTPFVLRRKKDQVLGYLPEKNHFIEYCELSTEQKEIYESELEISRKAIEARELAKETGESVPGIKNIGNILMKLRKASLHPLLFRKLYTDDIIKSMAKEIMSEERYKEANEQYIFEDMEVMNDYELNGLCETFPSTIGNHGLSQENWISSGKVTKLRNLLPKMKEDGDRVLLFSQFTQMLDILEVVLNQMNIKFLRLDGSTPVEIRQEMIDKFHNEEEITVFLLSTKAGGFGINLACANVVIIFDLSFNPHDDKQAEDRAHRVGQTREVKVIRMISKDTIEENILQLANTKLQLDKSVSNESAADEEKFEESNISLVASMLLGKVRKQENNK